MAEAAKGTLDGGGVETFKQYCSRRRDAIRREYSTKEEPLTKAGVLELYPDYVFWQDYISLMRNFAQVGGVFPARILDSIWAEDKAVVTGYMRHFPTSIPQGYLNPDARAIERQRSPVYTPKGNLRRGR